MNGYTFIEQAYNNRKILKKYEDLGLVEKVTEHYYVLKPMCRMTFPTYGVVRIDQHYICSAFTTMCGAVSECMYLEKLNFGKEY